MSHSDSKVHGKMQSAAFFSTLSGAVLPIGSWLDAKSDSFLARCRRRPVNRACVIEPEKP
jgi:hypothetical protein